MGSDPIKAAQCETDFKEAWEYCEKNIKSVEIFYVNENNQKVLAKVHFRFNSKVTHNLVDYIIIQLLSLG